MEIRHHGTVPFFRARAASRERRGFTLVEILTTVVIVGVLATAAVPIGQLMIIRQQEASLRQALTETRKAIDRFFNDYRTYPSSFTELRGEAINSNFTVCYLRDAPPLNPFTGDSSDWVIVTSGITEYTRDSCYETECRFFIAHNVQVFQFMKILQDRLTFLLQNDPLGLQVNSDIVTLQNQKIADGKPADQAYNEAWKEIWEVANLAEKQPINKYYDYRYQAEEYAIMNFNPSPKYFIPGPPADPTNVYYWGIWDIRYPREDRIAINETLYKDW